MKPYQNNLMNTNSNYKSVRNHGTPLRGGERQTNAHEFKGNPLLNTFSNNSYGNSQSHRSNIPNQINRNMLIDNKNFENNHGNLDIYREPSNRSVMQYNIFNTNVDKSTPIRNSGGGYNFDMNPMRHTAYTGKYDGEPLQPGNTGFEDNVRNRYENNLNTSPYVPREQPGMNIHRQNHGYPNPSEIVSNTNNISRDAHLVNQNKKDRHLLWPEKNNLKKTNKQYKNKKVNFDDNVEVINVESYKDLNVDMAKVAKRGLRAELAHPNCKIL